MRRAGILKYSRSIVHEIRETERSSAYEAENGVSVVHGLSAAEIEDVQALCAGSRCLGWACAGNVATTTAATYVARWGQKWSAKSVPYAVEGGAIVSR